jgi:hypothetical protein
MRVVVVPESRIVLKPAAMMQERAVVLISGASGASMIEAHERSARNDSAAMSVPAKAAMTVEEGRAAGAGGGGVMTAAAVISFSLSFFLPFIHGAWPSIPPPFA